MKNSYKNYKMGPYQPAKSPYYKKDFSICTGPTEFDPLFITNIHDLSDTLVKIMITFGVNPTKAKAVRSVIVKAFQFYDVKRHRFILRPEDQRSLTKCEIMYDFKCRGMMNIVEALLSYQLLKRAIKAFFLHTPSHSIRSPITEAIVLKEHEHAWKHAAERSAQIFTTYERFFFNAATNYKAQVTRLYHELFERFKSRAEPVIVEDYHPRGCVKKIVIGTQRPPKLDSEKQVCVEKCQKSNELREYLKTLPPKELSIKQCLLLPTPCSILGCDDGSSAANPNKSNFQKETFNADESRKSSKAKKPKNVDLNVPRCYQCNCPQIFCECNIDPNTGIVAIDCSQGPFECQWIRMNKVERLDPCIRKPEQHVCPIDCLMGDDSSSDSEFDCGYCVCSSESNTESTSDNDVEEQKLQDKQYYKDNLEEDDAYNDENLEKIMLKDMPKRKKSMDLQARCDDCALRVISTIPEFTPKINERRSITKTRKSSNKNVIKKTK